MFTITTVVFNMAARTGKFLQRSSAILSRLKHVSTVFRRHVDLLRGLPSQNVENYDGLFVDVDLDCC